jgi:hypothetical protein
LHRQWDNTYASRQSCGLKSAILFFGYHVELDVSLDIFNPQNCSKRVIY